MESVLQQSSSSSPLSRQPLLSDHISSTTHCLLHSQIYNIPRSDYFLLCSIEYTAALRPMTIALPSPQFTKQAPSIHLKWSRPQLPAALRPPTSITPSCYYTGSWSDSEYTSSIHSKPSTTSSLPACQIFSTPPPPAALSIKRNLFMLL